MLTGLKLENDSGLSLFGISAMKVALSTPFTFPLKMTQVYHFSKQVL
jgi:hypothetical protein